MWGSASTEPHSCRSVAPTAMVGKLLGVVKRVKDVAPLVTAVHCCIHREALATKTMSADLKTILDEAMRNVNFIKSLPLQSTLFAILCTEMGSDHRQLLLHTDWLISHGKVLIRLFVLRDEVCTFVDSQFELSYRFCDIFSYLNRLNLSLQGKAFTMFHVHGKIEATIRKLELWDIRVVHKNYESFDNLCEFLNKEERHIPTFVAGVIKEHLQTLKTQLRRYFPSLSEQYRGSRTHLPPITRMLSQASVLGSRTDLWIYLVILL